MGEEWFKADMWFNVKLPVNDRNCHKSELGVQWLVDTWCRGDGQPTQKSWHHTDIAHQLCRVCLQRHPCADLYDIYSLVMAIYGSSICWNTYPPLGTVYAQIHLGELSTAAKTVWLHNRGLRLPMGSCLSDNHQSQHCSPWRFSESQTQSRALLSGFECYECKD